MLDIRLLGTFEIRDGKKTISIASRPAQSLFAYLVLNAGTAQRREKLAGMLWPDSLEETARDNLRHSLWRIRKALPKQAKTEYLLTDDVSITFNASSEYSLDAEHLEHLADNCTADELIAALSEYQGELLPGFYEEWVILEREHLAFLFEHHMARLMALLQEQKRWLEILDWGERWIKLGQKPEPAYRALMAAHAAKGDMSKVAATYERCVKSLKEFSVVPSEQTRELYERLKAGNKTIEAGPTIPVRDKRIESRKSNLPIPLTSFIGRVKEVGQIVDLLGQNRLVTLIGAGGVGKTRLAIESAKRFLDSFKDGVWWVDLVGLNDPSQVPPVVARVLTVNEIPGQAVTDVLVENLRSKQLFLVLDNCEHLIAACTQLAGQLLTGCEKLQILATSREALDVLGEAAWHVPSLSLPDSSDDFSIKTLVESEGIRLFTERAAAKQPHFDLTYQNVQAVVQICHRLDGIPLAIELAAARIKVLSVEEIARRLDDRFNLLTVGNRSAPPRHQTLRAAIDWSYELLSKSEQSLFQRLSIFKGGFTLDTVTKICGFGKIREDQVLALLGRVVDKSLVFVETTSKEGKTRYRLLETIREYGFEKLIESGEERIVRDHHMEYFSQLAIEAEPNLFGAEAISWVNSLDAEHDNLLAAMDWSLKSENVDFALSIVGALLPWDQWHNSEGAERSLQVVQSPLANRPNVLRAKALVTAGAMQWFQRNHTQARSLLLEAVEIGKESAKKDYYVLALAHLGGVLTAEGHYETALIYLNEALVQSPMERSEEYGMGMALAYLGDIYLLQDNRQEAGRMYEDSIAQLRKLKNRNLLAYPLRRLSVLVLDRGEYKKATTLCKESLLLNTEGGDQRATIACLAVLAAIAAAQGHITRAVRLYAAVKSCLDMVSANLLLTDQRVYDHNVAMLHSQLDETTFDIVWGEGSEMTMDQAIELALMESKQ